MMEKTLHSGAGGLSERMQGMFGNRDGGLKDRLRTPKNTDYQIVVIAQPTR